MLSVMGGPVETKGKDPLLHRELFASIPLLGERIAGHLATAAEVSAPIAQPEPGVTFAVRAINEASLLEGLLRDVEEQDFTGPVEIVVVDNNSSDGTGRVAKNHGATVRNIHRGDFTYPKSMNMAMEAASYDTVFLTVGHALLASRGLLRAATRQLSDENVAAAFAYELPGVGASHTDRLVAAGLASRFAGPRQARWVRPGVMSARNCAISKKVWEELGRFDERYETGCEDTIMAGRILKAGYRIIEDPSLSVHHSHGDGPLGYIQAGINSLHARYIGPRKIDRARLPDQRPHLNFAEQPR